MLYDPIRAMLSLTGDELERLTAVVAAATDPGGVGNVARLGDVDLGDADQEWVDAGIVVGGRLHPTVGGILEVMNRPARSVMIERFSQGMVVPLFVAWDSKGRATLTEGTPDGDLVIQATSFDLLAPLLMHTLHLHRGIAADETRRPLTITAGELDRLLGGDGPASDGDEVVGEAAGDEAAGAEVAGDEVAAPTSDGDAAAGGDEQAVAVMSDLRFAWRAAGSLPGAETDTAVTALHSGATGVWIVEREAGTGSEGPGLDTVITLCPASVAEVTARLGDVVTGRRR